jgi:hypothetical protein
VDEQRLDLVPAGAGDVGEPVDQLVDGADQLLGGPEVADTGCEAEECVERAPGGS